MDPAERQRILAGLRDRAETEFGVVLARTAMTPESLAHLLRRHGWRVSAAAARAWAAGTARRRPPPPDLLAWLRRLAKHLRDDPLPQLDPGVARTQGEAPPPGELVDWLRRLAAYHRRDPPPPPPRAWSASAALHTPPRGRLH